MIKIIDKEYSVNRILKKLCSNPEIKYPVCLASQNDDRTLSRFSIISFNPSKLIDDSNPINALKEISTINTNLPGDDLVFNGGFIGFLSYNLLEDLFKLKLANQSEFPKILGGIYNQGIIIDHELKTTTLFNHHSDVAELEFYLDSKEEITLVQESIDFDAKLNITTEEYVKRIEDIKNYIKAGDVYEINFTSNYQLKTNKSSLDIFMNLSENNPAPFGAYLSFENIEIISASPELFYEKRRSEIKTQPMKGTIARTNDPTQNAINLKQLKNSIKDRSELTMIIDLMRNDLSKICHYNSVEVKNPFLIKEYPTVYQQVCDVCGILNDDVQFIDIIKALFPSGSITGAPKLRAIEVIDELENYPRKAYTGSIGYVSFNGNSCFNVAIRTIIKQSDNIDIAVGGAIVWDSTAADELKELKLKAKATLNACK